MHLKSDGEQSSQRSSGARLRDCITTASPQIPPAEKVLARSVLHCHSKNIGLCVARVLVNHAFVAGKEARQGRALFLR